jgi:hypothetical protein
VPYFIVPFLIELLNYEQVQEKELILALLQFMASYTYFQYEGEIYITKAQQIHEAIWGGLDIYIKLLNSNSAPVRVAIVDLISEYPEYAERIVPLILQRLELEDNDEVRAKILYSLNKSSLLIEGISPNILERYLKLLRRFLSSQYDQKLRLTAACYLIAQLKATTSRDVVNALVDGLVKEYEPHPFTYFPATHPNMQSQSLGCVDISA